MRDRPIAPGPCHQAIKLIIAPTQQAVVLIFVPVIVEIETQLRAALTSCSTPLPSHTVALALVEVETRTARVDAGSHARGHGLEARLHVRLSEDVDVALGRFVGALERLPDLVQPTSEPRVIGPIHGEERVDGDGGDGGGCMSARAVKRGEPNGFQLFVPSRPLLWDANAGPPRERKPADKRRFQLAVSDYALAAGSRARVFLIQDWIMRVSFL